MQMSQYWRRPAQDISCGGAARGPQWAHWADTETVRLVTTTWQQLLVRGQFKGPGFCLLCSHCLPVRGRALKENKSGGSPDVHICVCPVCTDNTHTPDNSGTSSDVWTTHKIFYGKKLLSSVSQLCIVPTIIKQLQQSNTSSSETRRPVGHVIMKVCIPLFLPVRLNVGHMRRWKGQQHQSNREPYRGDHWASPLCSFCHFTTILMT